MSKLRRYATILLALFSPWAARAAEPAKFEFRNNDRIVLVGGAFIERMQIDNHLETLLTIAHPSFRLTFRNLGWSGDTVWGESRALFGTPADGFARLIHDVKQTKPSVIMICYGANEANEGSSGLPRFIEGLNQLVGELADTQARMILISPPRRGRPSPRLPDPTSYNESLRHYARAIGEVTHQHKAFFVDVAALVRDGDIPTRADTETSGGQGFYAQDGIQLTSLGNERCAEAIAKGLGVGTSHAKLPPIRLVKLRDAIHGKNMLYFHRYRPQNETYLFLFRKHEQGNNAVEIPQFDPLIAEKERQIAELLKP